MTYRDRWHGLSYRPVMVLDGPRAGTVREMRITGGTMATMHVNGAWVFYDSTDRVTDVVHWRETGDLVSTPEGLVYGATEVAREYWGGVL